jgi:hypothetical protein
VGGSWGGLIGRRFGGDDGDLVDNLVCFAVEDKAPRGAAAVVARHGASRTS